MNNRIFKIISIVLLLLCLVTIFMFSSENSDESDETSIKVTKEVISAVGGNNVDNNEVNKIAIDYKNVARKIAHFIEYLFLGILSINVIACYKRINYKWLIICFIFCILYSISDKVHQLYVPGRSCELKDVIIDSIGSFIGIMIYYLVYRGKKVSKLVMK